MVLWDRQGYIPAMDIQHSAAQPSTTPAAIDCCLSVADDMDFQRCLDICMPYLGPVIGAYTDWTPLEGRNKLFPEDVDMSDPWQFKNVRVL